MPNFQPTPKQGRRLRKLKGNFTAVRHARLNRDNNAQFRLVVSLIRDHQSLAGPDTAGHRNQPAVSIDQDRIGFLVEWIATRRSAVNEHWNMHGNASRPAAIRRTSARCLSGITVRAFGKERSCPP